jgi:hypothetical protein
MGKVLHASGSGYFINCIEESGDSANAIWTLENAMKLYWRVRSWSFSASGILEEEGDLFSFSLNFNNIESYFYYEPDDEFIPTPREEQLVCGGESYPFFSEINNLTSPSLIEVGRRGVFKVGDLYNPSFEGEFANRFPYNLDFRMAASIPSLYPTISTVSLFGGVLPIGVRSRVGGEVISLTATLTPTEWWSYGGTYNTSTGEPL